MVKYIYAKLLSVWHILEQFLLLKDFILLRYFIQQLFNQLLFPILINSPRITHFLTQRTYNHIILMSVSDRSDTKRTELMTTRQLSRFEQHLHTNKTGAIRWSSLFLFTNINLLLHIKDYLNYLNHLGSILVKNVNIDFYST